MPEAGDDDDFVRQEARREEVEALTAMRGMDLEDPAVMVGAWPKEAEEGRASAQGPSPGLEGRYIDCQ